MGSSDPAHDNCSKEEWLEQLLARAESDAELIDKTRELRATFLFDTGDRRYLISLKAQHWSLLGPPRIDDSWDVAFRSSLASWKKLLSQVPPVGYQSFMALRACDPTFSIEGNQLLVAQALPALERLVEIARQTANGPCVQEAAPESQATHCAVRRDPGQIIGKYVDLPGTDKKTWRIYYEEVGSGTPLVLLHTAGADSRQFHDLLCDVEIAGDWRLLAFDLPYHGRSTPAHGWWQSPYRLTTETYAHWCITFIREVAKCRAVVMGSSMGAAMAVHLAARHRSEVCGAIGLEAPDRSPGRLNRFLTNPQVNQACFVPTYVYGLMSPQSPVEERHRAWWYYSQGGYGVYEGDLHFYSEEWDANKLVSEFDVSECPVYLLTGDYDYSATPESTRRLANLISGARMHVMPGLGHFPMTENPDAFRKYLVPILDELRHDLQKSR
ncbi:MAG: alpha/beta fold hydrolase [Thermodesulfobacteriota bacterium]